MCCPLSDGDGDEPTIHDVTTPCAGKDHRCFECGETIERGSKHELVKAMWDGHWSKFRTCLSCVEIRNHFSCGNGWIYGEVWSQLAENFFPEMKSGGPCMKGLSPEAKARLVDARMEWYLSQDEVDDNGIALPPCVVYEDGKLVRT